MKLRRSSLLGLAAVAALLGLLAAGAPHLSAQMRPPGGPGGSDIMTPDANAAQRDSLMNVVLEKIRGRENAPAESVFKNIQILKGIPAGRVPRMMNMGFGRSLGVGCFFCHQRGDWAKDDKSHLKIAREMYRMTATINTDLLAKIDLDKHGNEERPVVNCNTCHRGSPRTSPRPPPADSTRGGAPGQR